MNDRFYVLASDGLKHGPADLTTLQEWANQGRITPRMKLVDENGNVYLAGDKLNFLANPGAPIQINDPNSGPPPPGVYTPPGAGGLAGGYPPMDPYQSGTNPHWSPTGPVQNNPLLYGNIPGTQPYSGSNNLGCLASLLAVIGFEMCCTMVPSMIAVGFSIYLAMSGKSGGRMLVWLSSICLAAQLSYTIWWKFHVA